MASLPAIYNLEIYQGDDYSQEFRLSTTDDNGTFVDYMDLTGSTGSAQIRATAQATGSPITTFVVTIDPDQVGNKGKFTISLTHAVAAALPVTTTAVWDLQFVDALAVTRTYLKGSVTIYAEVTR